jgi:Succinate dehydrogenase/fumarate reductase, flavoprotein subunit
MTGQADWDLIVVGSGAAGWSAAVTAALKGLKVIVLEKAPYFGGTTASSGGWIWVPCSKQANEAGVQDSIEKARRYLEVETGKNFRASHVDAYLARAPEALDFLTSNSDLAFDLGPQYSDYHAEYEGGLPGGRALVARPYDARNLGAHKARLKPPLPETTFLGMMVGSGKELKHFFNATRSPVSAAYVSVLLARYVKDRVFFGRSMRLTNGSAMVARLAATAFRLGVELRLETPVRALLFENGGVTGVLATHDGKTFDLRARGGVVLASGGFAHDKAVRLQLYPHVRDGSDHYSAVDPHVTADSWDMVQAVGGEIISNFPNAAAWVPLSLVPRPDGSHGVFPHFIDRAKPGVMAVVPPGRRFVNEAVSYHDFIQALIKARAGQGECACWLIADHDAIRKYGLGHVKPFPVPMGPALKSGYLRRGNTLPELAEACGLDAQTLQTTVQNYSRHAESGEDPEYGRGTRAYNRYLGDPQHKPNPCVRPLRTPPFYAVRLVAGDLGTFAGIATDENARVLDQSGTAIPGLYAAGNDAASILSGTYPGAGITLGPAITFGYLAALDAADTLGRKLKDGTS